MDEPCPKDSKTVSYMENGLVWDIFVMTFSNVMWCGLSEYLALGLTIERTSYFAYVR